MNIDLYLKIWYIRIELRIQPQIYDSLTHLNKAKSVLNMSNVKFFTILHEVIVPDNIIDNLVEENQIDWDIF